VLFKGGIHLENIGKIKVVAFDKTGTLTEGKSKVTDIVPFHEYTESDILRLAASLESLSEHPIAKSIVQTAKGKNIQLDPASQLQAVPGLGVHGLVNGMEYRIGKLELLQDLTISKQQKDLIKELESQGKTVVFVAEGNQTIGLLAIQDTLRPQAKQTVEALKRMGIKVAMLTGDSKSTANAIGHQAGVDEVYAELLPEQKVEIIKELTSKYGKVSMVGDGVNDAPALATSSVGIAMGAAGTDVALETADVVLMADDISKIPYAISLGRRTSRVTMQNVSFAIVVIIVLVTSNFFGGINLPSGVVGHEGSTVAVILSGLRLLR
jgi:Cd2+/Zn2+-exporting ATPase